MLVLILKKSLQAAIFAHDTHVLHLSFSKPFTWATQITEICYSAKLVSATKKILKSNFLAIWKGGHNGEINSELQDVNSQFLEKIIARWLLAVAKYRFAPKKAELWDKKVAITGFIFYSVAETDLLIVLQNYLIPAKNIK